MGRLVWIAAALAAGCGNVAKTERPIDAGLADAVSCTAPELACDGTCVDVTSSNEHCGDCATTCATGSTCMTGHCVDNIKTCAQIHQVNDQAASGFYTLVDSTLVYCDMTTMIGYSTLVMAQFDAPPTGFTQVTAADLQDASKQAAFIQVYNNQGGLKVQTSWVSGNCCLKDDASNAMMLFLAGKDVYPSAAGVSMCSPSAGYLVGTTYQLTESPEAMPVYVSNMATNFFTTYPATAAAGCSVSTNPALFWKVIQ